MRFEADRDKHHHKIIIAHERHFFKQRREISYILNFCRTLFMALFFETPYSLLYITK